MSDRSKVENGFEVAWRFASPNAAEALQAQMQSLLLESY